MAPVAGDRVDLPIIPPRGTAADEVPLADWPRYHPRQLDALRLQFAMRLDALTWRIIDRSTEHLNVLQTATAGTPAYRPSTRKSARTSAPRPVSGRCKSRLHFRIPLRRNRPQDPRVFHRYATLDGSQADRRKCFVQLRLRCEGSYTNLRRSRTRFDSWRGHRNGSRAAGRTVRTTAPRECVGARRSSKPQGRVRFPGGGSSEHNGRTSSECDGFAHDPAKVGDQVQFLARASIGSARPFLSIDRSIEQRRWSQTARRPAATRFKWVRLPPASLEPAAGMIPSRCLCPTFFPSPISRCRHVRHRVRNANVLYQRTTTQYWPPWGVTPARDRTLLRPFAGKWRPCPVFVSLHARSRHGRSSSPSAPDVRERFTTARCHSH